MKDLTIHPLCALYPDLPEDELQALADDIRQNGQMMPILRWGKVVLDGKNRLKACGIAGVQPNFEDWYPTDPKDESRSHNEATAAAASLNLYRRHLTPSQRSLLSAGAANLQTGVTVAQAAAAMQVSERSVSSARKVLQDGSESLKDAVRNGEVTVSDAASVVDLPKSEQSAAVNAVRNGKAPTVRKAAEREPGDETEHKRPRTPAVPSSNAETALIDKLVSKLVSNLELAKKTADELFRAIDDKKAKSPAFANRHKSYEKRMRDFGNLLIPAVEYSEKLSAAWAATRKELNE